MNSGEATNPRTPIWQHKVFTRMLSMRQRDEIRRHIVQLVLVFVMNIHVSGQKLQTLQSPIVQSPNELLKGKSVHMGLVDSPCPNQPLVLICISSSLIPNNFCVCDRMMLDTNLWSINLR